MTGQNCLKMLSELIGVSGYEKNISDYIKEQISNPKINSVYSDAIGNLICFFKGKLPKKKIMIVAHMDEVGFQVMHCNEDGSAIVKTLGNIKTWNAFNQLLSSEDGSKEGLIYCENPKELNAYNFETLKVIPLLGRFEIGDVLGFNSNFHNTDSMWVGKALDNRISCYVLLKMLQTCEKTSDDVYFVFSVQEEIGMRGARVAISEILPDIVIDIDVSPVGLKNSLRLGKGVGIKLSDSIGVSNKELTTYFEGLAQENDIACQREVSDRGTTELIITNEKDTGAKRIGLSIPCMNMHSPHTVVYKNDVEACEKLLNILINQC